MGVRVRKWVSMHGLALNVDPNMSHFDLIVPCGLTDRSVTSLKRELGPMCPTMATARHMVSDSLVAGIRAAADAADEARRHAASS